MFMVRRNLEYAKQIAFSSEETLMFSYECGLNMKDTEGDYVECGVAAGAQIIAMATASPNKIIHAFDSFDGIPLPCNRDDQMPGIRYLTKEEQKDLPNAGEQELVSSGATVIPLDGFIHNLMKCDINLSNITIHKGWFEETLPKTSIAKISILRLDGDLYNSTLVCLQYLFNNVIEGGIVIIDDYELEGCKNACDDYFKSIGYEPKYKKISNISYFIK
jgi:O-methyltransferase